jgi:hypothetical protein
MKLPSCERRCPMKGTVTGIDIEGWKLEIGSVKLEAGSRK